MDRGFFKFYRKAQDSSSWDRGLIYQGLIINLLTRAAWKKTSYKGCEIQPGQFGTVISQLAESLGVPRTTLQRMLSHLEEDDFLKVENVGNRFCIISIVNWHIYQGTDKDECANDRPPIKRRGQPMGNRQEQKRATNGQPNSNGELKNSQTQCQEVGNQWATEGGESGQPLYMEDARAFKTEEVKKEEINTTPLTPLEGGQVELSSLSANKPRRKRTNQSPALDTLIKAYTDSPNLRRALTDFRQMREKLRKPMTPRALELIFGKLNDLGGASEQHKIALLEQSIVKAWQDIYPLKEIPPEAKPPPRPETPQEREARKRREEEQLQRLVEQSKKRDEYFQRQKQERYGT